MFPKLNKNIAPFIAGLLIGGIIVAVVSKIYISTSYEKFQNDWVPKVESSRFKMSITSASFFLSFNNNKSSGCLDEKPLIKNLLKSLNLDDFSLEMSQCEMFPLDNAYGVAYFVSSIKNGYQYLIFQELLKDSEVLIRVPTGYPGNTLSVKSDGVGTIAVFLEGWKNPAKTLLLEYN